MITDQDIEFMRHSIQAMLGLSKDEASVMLQCLGWRRWEKQFFVAPAGDDSVDLQLHLATLTKHSGPSVSCSFAGWHSDLDSMVNALNSQGRYLCTQTKKSTS